jgi:hypothetical protein
MSEATLSGDNHHLIASDRVEGTAVYNAQGVKLGAVHNFLIHKASGRVELVIIRFGGLLGVGVDHFPLPWGMLAYKPEVKGYVADVDRAVLENAPRYGDVRPDYDLDYDDMVRAYYDERPTPFI